MTVPLPPEDPDQAPFHRPGMDSEQAHELVSRAIEEYNARLVAARRFPGRDTADTVAGWRTARDRAADDAGRLSTADAAETARLTVEYAARLRELQQES
ncbi:MULTISPECIES: hypothetical protein [unclassified Streptomyces]|uniref:hypothetical protein n=1 Tax=unclassified Streptomyces TaxID=2593676 RepID=UPI0013A6B5F1|nr:MULTISPECIES: hypothetical protein [unclassified Streptomyces]